MRRKRKPSTFRLFFQVCLRLLVFCTIAVAALNVTTKYIETQRPVRRFVLTLAIDGAWHRGEQIVEKVVRWFK